MGSWRTRSFQPYLNPFIYLLAVSLSRISSAIRAERTSLAYLQHAAIAKQLEPNGEHVQRDEENARGAADGKIFVFGSLVHFQIYA